MVSPVSVLYFLNLPVIPGFSGYMNTFANTYTVPCWVCERSWGSSSMHQLLVGQYAMPGSAGSIDRKSTRLNSSHSQISYAVFCLKKKKSPNFPRHRLL